MKALLLLTAFLQAVPPPADIEEEIVVVGRRLSALSAIVGRDGRGKLTCALTESSGVRSIDSALCRTAAKCVGKGALDQAAVGQCITKRKPAILQEFAARVRARQGNHAQD